MNLDSPWPNKTSAEVQQASVGAAEFGCFPTAEGEGVTPIINTNVSDFSTAVTDAGLQMVTPPTSFTTLKMRTKFQAQAGKIGAVAIGHKDQVSECWGAQLHVSPQPKPRIADFTLTAHRQRLV